MNQKRKGRYEELGINLFTDDVSAIDETESFLAQLPVGLIKESIETQFKDPENYRMDYVSSFMQSYQYSIENMEDDDDKDTIEEMKDNFIDFMVQLFEKRLHLGFENFEEMGDGDKLDTLLFTYRFFILGIRKNFLNVIWNYIQENKEDLQTKVHRKKDITSQTFRKEISEEDTTIIANLSEIIDMCLMNENLDVDEFFRLAEGNNPSTELTIISEKFDNFEITGNFVPHYVRMLRSPMRIRIEGELRNRILKSYRVNA